MFLEGVQKYPELVSGGVNHGVQNSLSDCRNLVGWCADQTCFLHHTLCTFSPHISSSIIFSLGGNKSRFGGWAQMGVEDGG